MHRLEREDDDVRRQRINGEVTETVDSAGWETEKEASAGEKRDPAPRQGYKRKMTIRRTRPL
jgi:hypothetical protein